VIKKIRLWAASIMALTSESWLKGINALSSQSYSVVVIVVLIVKNFIVVFNITRTPPVEVHRPLLLIYSFQFRSAFHATTMPSQPRPLDTIVCVDHAQPATDKAPTSVTDSLVVLIVV